VFDSDDCFLGVLGGFENEFSNLVIKSSSNFTKSKMKSVRNCNEMESRPQIGLDYYKGSGLTGRIKEFRNICSCLNLPVLEQYSTSTQSIKTYGNCLTYFPEADCGGIPYFETKVIQPPPVNSVSGMRIRSLRPCEILDHCILR